MTEEEKEVPSNNVNNIIQKDNYDERNEKIKEPSSIHPAVQARLEREKNFSNETTKINEPIPESALESTESNDQYVSKSELKELENRVARTVEQINDQFSQIQRSLTAVVNEVRGLAEKDKTYKSAFVSLENRLSSILRSLNSGPSIQ